jgi:thiol-disulfide isomerase/thioredoxin
MHLRIKINFFFIFLFFAFVLQAQKSVSVYKIDDLLKRIHNNSDTVYVVNFWATWCKPCVQELPEFEKFNRENKTKIVKVLLVSLDFKEDIQKKLMPFLEKNKYSMECVLLDEINGNDFINKINTKWSGAVPATLFTTKNKKSEHFYEKKLSLEILNSTLTEF